MISRYPFPHRLPIKWYVVKDATTGRAVIYATCQLPGGAEYATWHVMPCRGSEASNVLVCLVVETLTMEIMDVVGATREQPVGLMAGVQ